MGAKKSSGKRKIKGKKIRVMSPSIVKPLIKLMWSDRTAQSRKGRFSNSSYVCILFPFPFLFQSLFALPFLASTFLLFFFMNFLFFCNLYISCAQSQKLLRDTRYVIKTCLENISNVFNY